MNNKKEITSPELSKLRNIAIVAHIDAGKTTLTERVIYYAQAKGKHKIGEVHEGNTTTDYLAQERERGITIVAAAVQLTWLDHTINLIDSPGHVDFTIEVERCLSVLEGAVLVIDGSAGVQPQTECVWRQANKYKVSRLVFINKLDKEGASFNFALDSLKARLSKTCVPIQIPYIVNEKFVGIFDLVDGKLYIWDGRDHNYKLVDYADMDDAQKSMYHDGRTMMLDHLSIYSDEIMDQYLESGDVEYNVLVNCIINMCHKMQIYPVLCGSAFHNKGVQLLLDAVTRYLPNPMQSSNSVQEMKKESNGAIVEVSCHDPDPVLFCFKWARDRHVGPISYCRIYSGKVAVGAVLYNSTSRIKTRIINVVRLFANQYENVNEAYAGDIVGIVGQHDIITGNVLSLDSARLIMHKIDIPESIVHLAIRPMTEQDQDKFSKHIHDYMREDPTISFEYSEQKETILKGVGSLQLDVLVSRMKTEKGINLHTARPKVTYRTTITQSATLEYIHKKQTGGAGQYGKVVLTMEPCPESEFEFLDEIRGGAIPEQYVPAIKASVIKTLKTGVFNCPVINVRVRLIDGGDHKVDSSDLAFQEAARKCINQLLPKCGPVLLEPYAKLTVYTTNEYASKVISDVCSKNGEVINVENDDFADDKRILTLSLAMSYTFDYVDVLRCISSGYGSCTYVFSGYKVATVQPDINTSNQED